MAEQASGPSGFDWLNAVWSGSESRGEVTLNSQLVDAKSLSLATQMQALLGSTNMEFRHAAVAGTNIKSTPCTIESLINQMGNISKSQTSEIGVVNSEVANMQQEQSLNTQTAGQGVQMSSNQVTQVDSTNQTSVIQLLGALVGQVGQWANMGIN